MREDDIEELVRAVGRVALKRGEPLELFRREGDGSPGKRMLLAAEVLVPSHVRDTFGTSAKLKHTFKFKHAYDKAPNAIVVFGVSSVDEHGEEVVYNEMTTFVKGAGGTSNCWREGI